MARKFRGGQLNADLDDTARMHGRYMGITPSINEQEFEALKAAMLIKNEMYDMGLFPDQAVIAAARNSNDRWEMNTEPMIIVGDDMRRFYGIKPRQGVSQKAEDADAALERQRSRLAAKQELTKGENYKQDYVETVDPKLTNDVQASINDLLNNESIKTGVDFDLTNKELDQLLLLAAAVGLAGGGFAAGTANQQNKMTEHEEAMLYALNQHVYI